MSIFIVLHTRAKISIEIRLNPELIEGILSEQEGTRIVMNSGASYEVKEAAVRITSMANGGGGGGVG